MLAASGITAGAFGAHALSKRLGDKGSQTWGTAACAYFLYLYIYHHLHIPLPTLSSLLTNNANKD